MADDTDLAAIREWVAQGGKIGVDKEGNPVLPSGILADDAPTQATPATPAAPAAPTPAEPETMTQAAQPKAQPTPKAQSQPKAPRPRTREPWYERLSDWVGERAANAPTPGGNLALVLLLLFFAFAIIPVNAGKTRLQLIWLVLTGGADLPGQGAASGPDSANTALAQAGASSFLGGLVGTLTGGSIIPSGGGPGGPNAAGYIPSSQLSGAGGLLEPPR